MRERKIKREDTNRMRLRNRERRERLIYDDEQCLANEIRIFKKHS